MIDDKRNLWSHVRPDWNPARQESVSAGIKRRQHKRRFAQVATISLSTAALIMLVWYLGPVFTNPVREEQLPMPSQWAEQTTQNPNRAISENAPEPRPISMKDGSTATPLDQDSQIVIDAMTETHMAVRILEGGGRFRVVSNKERVFEVMMDDVTVAVIGTSFVVNRTDDRVKVSVNEGHVRVSWPGGESDLFGGQSGVFPPQQQESSDTVLDSADKLSSRHNRKFKKKKRNDWRELARSGSFEEASSLLSTKAEVRDTVDDLLLAADAMRLSRKPAKALPYLRRVVKDHANDPRAALAEFTRGKILLFQLRRPGQAATAFAHTQKLAPRSSLAQDALAREVEAHHKAGNASRAKERAREYVDKYPQGRRVDSVRRFGNLEK